MLSDLLPTGFECGVLNGKVPIGGSVAIVGSGPIGLAAFLTEQFYSTSERFKLKQVLQAYETFGEAAKTKALKVIIET